MTATAWPTPRLDALRAIGDPELDGLLDEVRERDRDAVRTLFRNFARSHLELDPATWPPAVLDWWHDGGAPPGWVDQNKLTRAVELFERWMPEVFTSYLLASLPTSYAGADGALVLSRISLLYVENTLTRRVLETLVFALRVNERGGLEADGAGLVLARKTRIFHALVRVMIQDFQFHMGQPDDVGEPWDDIAHGVPVNQEDQLGTLWTFALTPLEVLERAGVRFSEDDRDAIVHLWCVVGHHLGIGAGIDPPLLPMTHAEAAASWDSIKEHQFKESPHGRELTKVLVGRCRELIPVWPLKGLPEAAMFDNVGGEVAVMLGLHRQAVMQRLLHLSRALFRLSLRLPLGDPLRVPLAHLLKRFALEWLLQARAAPGDHVEVPKEQLRRLMPLYLGPRRRREAASLGVARV